LVGGIRRNPQRLQKPPHTFLFTAASSCAERKGAPAQAGFVEPRIRLSSGETIAQPPSQQHRHHEGGDAYAAIDAFEGHFCSC
jgi:hypothetical protein